MHAQHVAQDRYFHRSWPSVDVSRWPGRELLWAWRHPLFTILVLPAVVIIDLDALRHLIASFG